MAVETQTDQVQELIDRLSEVRPAAGFPVLSLYLDTRPGQNGRDQFQAFVRKELAARRPGVDAPDRHSYDRDTEKILRWLQDDLDPAANGAAVFACDGRELFEAVQLQVPIEESRLHVDRQPHLYTLARVLDLHPRYAALVTDTNLARIFVFDLGARRSQATVQSEKLRRHDMGGWSQMHYQRHVDGRRQQHAKEVMAALERIVRADDVAHVVLSGDEVALRLLRQELPKALQPKVVDMVQLDAKATEDEVLRVSLETLRRREAETDAERVAALLDEWRAGGLGAAGLRETEAALALGQVHELLLSADPMQVREHQADTEEAGATAAGATEEERQKQIELCDRLVALAHGTDARVHFVEDASLLSEVGGVGALLRYRIEARSGDARQA
jgi:peptide subunit release factor 1 (eRF1)